MWIFFLLDTKYTNSSARNMNKISPWSFETLKAESQQWKCGTGDVKFWCWAPRAGIQSSTRNRVRDPLSRCSSAEAYGVSNPFRLTVLTSKSEHYTTAPQYIRWFTRMKRALIREGEADLLSPFPPSSCNCLSFLLTRSQFNVLNYSNFGKRWLLILDCGRM